MLLALWCNSASAQSSSAGSLRCGSPDTSDAAAKTKKHDSKADKFKAIQQQETQNQQVIQKAGDDILNGAKGSGESDLDSTEPAEGGDVDASSDDPSTEPMAARPPGTTPTVNGLLDTDPPPPNSAAAVNSLLGGEPGATPNSATAVNSLLGDPPGATAQPSHGPTIPSLATIDAAENAEAQSFGSDWASSLASLKDDALSELRKPVPNPSDSVASLLDQNDPLKESVAAVIGSFLPQSNESEITLGSIVRDKFVDIASDKVADTLTDAKDEAACSSENSTVEHNACMVLMAPTNLGRSSYGQILLNRTSQMLDSLQAEFFPGQTQ
jgi:hypothetical protein